MNKVAFFLSPPLVLSLCSLLVIAVLWLYRATFFTPFDYHYVRQFYDHSQWTVAFSQRKMGDGLLYQIAGYELLTKASFTDINPEAPPLGKYLLGLSIITTGSAAWVNVPLYLLLLWFTYLLSREIFAEKTFHWLAVFLVAWQPLVWQQLPQTTLDLGQVTWLMGWLVSVIKLAQANKQSQHYLPVLGAGVFLGLFMSTKIALFLGPLILCFGIWFIYRKKFVWLMLSFLIACGVYGSMYLPYILNTDLRSAASLQKWILSYWFSSQSRAVPGVTLLSLATGWYLGHWKNAQWIWLAQWNPTWLIGTFVFVWLFLKRKINLQKITLAQTALSLTLAALVVSLSVVPLFERYLLLIIPLVVLSGLWVISLLPKYRLNVLALLVGWTVIQTSWLLPPSLGESIKEIERVAAVPAYQELWAFLDPQTQAAYPRDEFWRYAQMAHYQAGISTTTWKIQSPKFTVSWQKKVPVTITVTHQTVLGELSFTQPAALYRQDGRWMLQWDWGLVLPEWQPDRAISLEIQLQSNRLVNSQGVVIVDNGQVPTVFVTPSQIKDELTMNSQIENLTGLTKPYQELLYKVSQLPDQAQQISPVLPYVDSSALGDLDPGISILSAPGRRYHPTVTKDSAVTQRIMEFEQMVIAPPAGQLKVSDPTKPDQPRVLLRREARLVLDTPLPATVLPTLTK